MNMLNNSGPNIEPWGVSQQVSDHLLYEEPSLVLCFRKLRLPTPNPYASNFAISESCDKQSCFRKIH